MFNCCVVRKGTAKRICHIGYDTYSITGDCVSLFLNGVNVASFYELSKDDFDFFKDKAYIFVS